MRKWLDGEPQRIVVFRALPLGEMLCAVPALRALKLGFESAEITLIGLPSARPWAQRVPYIDDFLPAGTVASLERLGEILAGVRAGDLRKGSEAAASTDAGARGGAWIGGPPRAPRPLATTRREPPG